MMLSMMLLIMSSNKILSFPHPSNLQLQQHKYQQHQIACLFKAIFAEVQRYQCPTNILCGSHSIKMVSMMVMQNAFELSMCTASWWHKRGDNDQHKNFALQEQRIQTQQQIWMFSLCQWWDRETMYCKKGNRKGMESSINNYWLSQKIILFNEVSNYTWWLHLNACTLC